METGTRFNPWRMFTGIYIPNCIVELTEISSEAKLIWGRLSQYLGEGRNKDYCHPKQETLSVELGIPLTSIRRAIKELEKNKFIEIERPDGQNRLKHLSSRYYFLWHQSLVPRSVQSGHSEGDESGHSNIKRVSINESQLEDVSKDTSIADSQSAKMLLRRKSSVIKQALKNNPIKHPEKKSFEPTEKSKAIVRYWKDRMGLHTSRENSKRYKRDFITVDKLLNGTIFNNTEFEDYRNRKFTSKEIREAINRFALAAFNEDYLPNLHIKKLLQKTTIGNFIHNYFANGNGIGKSQFIHYLENEPKIARTPVMPIDDDNPGLTKAVKRKYTELILGGVDANFSVVDNNHFKIAGRKVSEFFEKYKSRIYAHNMSPAKMAEYLVLSIVSTQDGVKLNKIQPSWLSSDTAFGKRLPAYLHDQAILMQPLNRDGVSRGPDSAHFNMSLPIDKQDWKRPR